MKHFGKRFLSGLILMCMLSSLFCISAFAIQDSSAYISHYAAAVNPRSGGRMLVTLDIASVGYMDEVGATEIHIYESTDDVEFTLIESYYVEDHPEFLTSGTLYYEDAVTFYGTPGHYYMATILFYAGDETGGDTRIYDTYSVRCLR